ncbi:hypothetical protein [Limosilactobacillus caecicola]|uniref:hypothetical protein n=1 Tax=Limosilactobacillus caecicola TaxID=2941332 RepID=UPI00203B723B|nr:hypothetical protein [Limosilactobacillus caecicola]
MGDLIKRQFMEMNWKDLLPTTFILLIAWSYAPFAYTIGVQGSHFTANMGMLFLYEACIGLVVPMLIYHQFGSTLSVIPLIASALFAVIGFSTTPLLLALLLLLPLFLFIIQMPSMDFQNTFGLVTFGGLLMSTVSVGCAYVSLHFISWEIIIFLLPMMASTWFYLAPFFIKNGRQYKLKVTIFAIILLVFTLSRPLHTSIYLALIVTVASWFVMIAQAKAHQSLILYCLTQMVVIVLIYWS